MKSVWFFVLCAACAPLSANVVSNKVVFIDQDNNINAPEVIASVADMTTNKTEIALAQATAQAARSASAEATALIDSTVQKIVEDELVVYCHGFTDSLGVLVTLPPDTKCRIGEFVPNVAVDGEGNAQHKLVYFTTADASAVVPEVMHLDSLERGTNNFAAIESTFIGGVEGSFVDGNETTYNYGYEVRFWLPAADAGFFKIFLDADAAQGDGMTFDVAGGITGGTTETVTVGSDTLVFKGGLLMEVKRNETE